MKSYLMVYHIWGAASLIHGEIYRNKGDILLFQVGTPTIIAISLKICMFWALSETMAFPVLLGGGVEETLRALRKCVPWGPCVANGQKMDE